MRKIFIRYYLILFLLAAAGLSSCNDKHAYQEYIEETSDIPESAYYYIGNRLEGMSADSIGSAIGLSEEKTRELAKAIAEHDNQQEKIKHSDYAPYLKGILLQDENERYRNSVIEAIGYDDYRKWFDYDRAGIDRKIKESYNLDDEQYEEFKKIVKENDIALRLTKRNWISDEQKKVEIDSIIKKRWQDLKPIISSDIPVDKILMRTNEFKF